MPTQTTQIGAAAYNEGPVLTWRDMLMLVSVLRPLERIGRASAYAKCGAMSAYARLVVAASTRCGTGLPSVPARAFAPPLATGGSTPHHNAADNVPARLQHR